MSYVHKWARGDYVQKGEPGTDEHDTGIVLSATRFGVRVRWNGADVTHTERASDLAPWKPEVMTPQVEDVPPPPTAAALPLPPPLREFITPEGLRARVVQPRSTAEKLHEWHRERGEGSLRHAVRADVKSDPRGSQRNARGSRGGGSER